MTLPVFSAEFQQRLKLEKYTAWAHDLTEEHLAGLLWHVGEVGARGHCMLDLFDSHPEICLSSPAQSQSIRMRLECIQNFDNDRLDVAEAKRRFAQARSRMQIADLPDHVRRSIAKAAPGIRWNHVSMSEYGYELFGHDENARECCARVDHEERFTFRIVSSTSVIPEAAQAAFRNAFPDLDLDLGYCLGIWAINQECHDYEVRIPRGGPRALRIVVSADGRRIRPAREFGRAQIFSETFRESLNLGKYTGWAADLSEASLEGLLWILGAVATETLPLLKPINALVDLETWPDGNVLRPRIALEGIFQVVVHGERDVEQIRSDESYWDQWQRARQEAIPVEVRRAVEKAIPRARLTQPDWHKSAQGYRTFGEYGIDPYFSVLVRHDGGHVVVSKSMPKEKVPRAILSALKLRLPTYESLIDVLTEGSEWGRVDRYILCVRLREGERRVVISPDGAKVEIGET